MATSNSTDWTLTRDEVITAALRKLAVLPSGGTASTSQISDAAVSLNGLVKAFQADGMPLWKNTVGGFTTTAGTDQYAVGPGLTVDIPKPLRITQAYYTTSGGTNTLMNVYTRYDFYDLPTNASGTPINFYYKPQRINGVIRLWPTPSDSTTVINFHYQSPYEDMDSSSNDFDFPSEWMNPIIYRLAHMLAPEYGIPLLDRKQLEKEASDWHQYVLGMGSEEGSVFFQPNRDS